MNHVKHAMCAAALAAAGCQARDLTDSEKDTVNDAIDRYAENVPLYADLFEKMDKADVVPEREDLLDRDVLVEGLRNSGDRLRQLMDDGRVRVIVDKFETADEFYENAVPGAENTAKSGAYAAAAGATDNREGNDEIHLRAFEQEGHIIIDDEILIHEMGHHVARQGHVDEWGYQKILDANTEESLFSEALTFGDVAYTLSGVTRLAWHMNAELASEIHDIAELKQIIVGDSSPEEMREFSEIPLDTLLVQYREQFISGAVESGFNSEGVLTVAGQYGLEPDELANIYRDHYDTFFRGGLEREWDYIKEDIHERLAGEPREARAEFRPPSQGRK